MIKIDWTPEKKDLVCSRIEEFLHDTDCSRGESFMQNDECQLGIVDVMVEIIDDILQPEWSDDNEG